MFRAIVFVFLGQVFKGVKGKCFFYFLEQVFLCFMASFRTSVLSLKTSVFKFKDKCFCLRLSVYKFFLRFRTSVFKF